MIKKLLTSFIVARLVNSELPWEVKRQVCFVGLLNSQQLPPCVPQLGIPQAEVPLEVTVTGFLALKFGWAELHPEPHSPWGRSIQKAVCFVRCHRGVVPGQAGCVLCRML